MDVLQRITNLRHERNWSEYQLAEQSGLTPSTISSWYHKNLIPSIPSIERICKAFGITMSQFFLEENHTSVNLSPTQIDLLKVASKYSAEELNKLIVFLDAIK